MSSDIVERLRARYANRFGAHELIIEAAEEIERLRERELELLGRIARLESQIFPAGEQG